jgi:muramoyltetrapeptide carboxypeptidase
MKAVKPKRLVKGDLIGIISPASSPKEISLIESGVIYLEGIGYRVETGKNVGKYQGYLAGSDEERLSDLHYMFRKKEVKAIFCLRGGYGSGRLLDKIDYNLIKKNPKIFVGYSDITALQLSFFKNTGLITFAGPMVAVDFSSDVSKYTEEMFWRLLTSTKKYGKIKLPNNENILGLTKGNASGRVIGGNLSTVVSIIGTRYFPDFKDKILLLEDVGEMPYKLDRMLNQLRLNQIFEKVKGIILGSFIDCIEHDPNKKTLTLGEVADHYFSKLKKPVIYNFKHGHIKDFVTVPIGAMIKINATKNYVEINESAVS